MTDHPLVAFYAARLDEEEAAAKAAQPGPWTLDEWTGGFGRMACVMTPLASAGPNAKTGLTSLAKLGTQDYETARHIAGHDPEAVLAGVLADRHILGRWTALQSPVTLMDRATFPSLARVVLACIADRAARFKSHPGYDPAWSMED